MGAKADPDVDALSVPFVNENKAPMRLPLVIESERAQSGDLPIQPVDNPVIDDKPFKNLRSR